METVWYIRKITCRNGVEERTKYPVRSDRITGRQAKREAKKAALRNDNAERQLARLLNNNFAAQMDVHLVLEYTDDQLHGLAEKTEMALRARTEAHESNSAHESDITRESNPAREDAEDRDELFREGQRDLARFVRRVRRECRKQGVELRYVGATSDMDGETGEAVRLHQHFVCNREAAEICRAKWRGFVWEDRLYEVNGDFSALAAYLVKQVRPVEGTQRYVPSRNLEQPDVSEPVPLVGAAAKNAESEMRLPKGCILLYRSTYVRGACQYIRYLRPRRE